MDEQIIEPKPKGKPGRKPQQPQMDINQIVTTLMEQNRLLMEQLGKQQSESTLALAAELRKPTEMEEKKLREESEALKKRALMAVQAAEQSERQIKAKQRGCTHQDGNGVTCFNGQVDSSGRWAVLCNRCQLPAPKIKATPEERMSGINLRSWQNMSYEGLLQLYKQRESLVA